MRAPRRSARWSELLAALGLAGALTAQSPANTHGPDDAFVRERAANLLSGAEIDAIARRYADRDQLDLTSVRILAHRKIATLELERKRWSNAAGLLQKAIEFATAPEIRRC